MDVETLRKELSIIIPRVVNSYSQKQIKEKTGLEFYRIERFARWGGSIVPSSIPKLEYALKAMKKMEKIACEV